MRPSMWFGGALAAVGVLVSGCAGGSNDPGIATAGGDAQHPSASPTPSLSPQEAALKFAQCMRAHGVNMPDPQFGSGGKVSIRITGRGLSPQRMQQAQDACKQYSPIGSGGPGKVDPADQEKALEFAKCMRDHGVDMPDPQFGSGGGVTMRVGGPGHASSGGKGPNPNDPTFRAAIQACNHLLGGKGGPGLTVNGGPK